MTINATAEQQLRDLAAERAPPCAAVASMARSASSTTTSPSRRSRDWPRADQSPPPRVMPPHDVLVRYRYELTAGEPSRSPSAGGTISGTYADLIPCQWQVRVRADVGFADVFTDGSPSPPGKSLTCVFAAIDTSHCSGVRPRFRAWETGRARHVIRVTASSLFAGAGAGDTSRPQALFRLWRLPAAGRPTRLSPATREDHSGILADSAAQGISLAGILNGDHQTRWQDFLPDRALPAGEWRTIKWLLNAMS
jgi:hypothetical protein